MAFLKMRDGLSTDNALFKIASDEIHTHASEMIQELAQTNILNRAAGHEVHLHVKRNGNIIYRLPMKV